jgi:hypothetical protein
MKIYANSVKKMRSRVNVDFMTSCCLLGKELLLKIFASYRELRLAALLMAGTCSFVCRELIQ